MRIVIGEDSALFREGLARLLADAGHEIVGKAENAPTLISTVLDEKPDLAIIDIRMPPDRTDDGARAARSLRKTHPTLGIVLLSQHLETRHSIELVTRGPRQQRHGQARSRRRRRGPPPRAGRTGLPQGLAYG